MPVITGPEQWPGQPTSVVRIIRRFVSAVGFLYDYA